MSDQMHSTTIDQEGPNILLRYRASGSFEVLATAPFGDWGRAVDAIRGSVEIIGQVNQKKLCKELRDVGFSEESIKSICLSLRESSRLSLRDIDKVASSQGEWV